DLNKISNHVEYSRISDDNLENEIEDLVEENNKYYDTDSVLIKCSIIRQAINTGRFLSCKISDDHVLTVIEPISLNNNTLKCYCYLKNAERNLMVSNLSDLIIRNKPITIRLNGTLGVSKIKEVIKNAIEYNKIVRMKYTRSGWTDQRVDMETGEIILNITESEQSLRTICNIDYAINVLDEEHLVHYGMSDDNYITAFCNLRNEIRTFRVDRINEIEILNV
ncbi:MAG: WYL domain-containing protein, partial [Thiohalospira sp.]